jgi:hypothetical protein
MPLNQFVKKFSAALRAQIRLWIKQKLYMSGAMYRSFQSRKRQLTKTNGYKRQLTKTNGYVAMRHSDSSCYCTWPFDSVCTQQTLWARIPIGRTACCCA